jgi:riboflavin biosynthesis pyrimidine reductase
LAKPAGRRLGVQTLPCAESRAARRALRCVLIELDLIDEFRLMIDPLLVGGGKRLFPEDGTLRPLELVESEVVSTGATLATYLPAAR